MQSDGATECDNRCYPADAAKHEREASYHVTDVNALRDPLTPTV